MKIEHYITDEAKAEICIRWATQNVAKERMVSARAHLVSERLRKDMEITEDDFYTEEPNKDVIFFIVLRLEFDWDYAALFYQYKLGNITNVLYDLLKKEGKLEEIENAIPSIHVVNDKIQTIH